MHVILVSNCCHLYWDQITTARVWQTGLNQGCCYLGVRVNYKDWLDQAKTTNRGRRGYATHQFNVYVPKLSMIYTDRNCGSAICIHLMYSITFLNMHVGSNSANGHFMRCSQLQSVRNWYAQSTRQWAGRSWPGIACRRRTRGAEITIQSLLVTGSPGVLSIPSVGDDRHMGGAEASCELHPRPWQLYRAPNKGHIGAVNTCTMDTAYCLQGTTASSSLTKR